MPRRRTAFMSTECNQFVFGFHPLKHREIRAQFDGGAITTEGGGLLLREVEKRIGIVRQLAACFRDYRNPDLIEHSVEELVAQRVYGLALGYEDLNDHEELRKDPLLAVLVEKSDLAGEVLAEKTTLNRLELTPATATAKARYKKIVADHAAVDRLFVDVFLAAHRQAPQQIILDLDATDDPLHGNQEGRFFHGYYGHYCYLPLYVFCGDHLLGARLRPSNIDASAGSLEEVQRIVRQIRARWPKTRIILRADSGFCREELLTWCENSDVDYVFGFARNKRLRRIIGRAMQEAKQEHQRTGKPARVFCEFTYRTKKSWSQARRVIAKAEQIEGKENPRYLVTSVDAQDWPAQKLYEQLYCARGEMENRIKEQLSLFADRLSTETLHANQLRLYFSSLAYVLVEALRRLGLAGTEWAEAQVDTIRLKLLKIAAQVRITARRICVRYSCAYPWQNAFAAAWTALRC